jgi:diguanylate cyclase (GGDEF)-like protein
MDATPHPATQCRQPMAWKYALLAGFAVQVLLVLFVTLIGLRQLDLATYNLESIVDVQMRKQNFAKAMALTARQRTLLIFMMSKTDDPFELDALLMQFRQMGSEFVAARQGLMAMPLNDRETKLLERQRQLIIEAQPIQEHIVDLIMEGRDRNVIDLVLSEAIPAQNAVQAIVTQLDAETQHSVTDASRKARVVQAVARSWMLWLSGASLLVGVIVAVLVLRYTSRISIERERLATHDTLTGLPNRMLFLDRLEQALARAERRNALVGVIFIDLDRFKRVNDTLGHASGDQLIREVAQRLRAASRAEDTVARLGGDEFVVVIGEAGGVNDILQVAEKMLAAIGRPFRIAGHELFSSCSIGISVFPNDGADSSTLLKHADTAMYHAKQHGRDRLHLYDPAMNAMAEERLQLETDLHYALARHEFIFHYQPQLDVDGGRIVAFEALMRWRHPTRGLLAPGDFLDLLEAGGDILKVGRALLLDACREAAAWHAAGHPELGMSVNVSGKEFWHESLLANVRDALAQSGLPPAFLQLELTEGIFMEDMHAAIERVHELKALGVSIAVDDFGTGYSSLAHLKRFPLDAIKIDRLFIRDLVQAPVNRALITSILALCEGLRLAPIAEGVEDAAQLDALRVLGCRIVQGYLISRPVPAAEVPALLQRDWAQAFDRAAGMGNQEPVGLERS